MVEKILKQKKDKHKEQEMGISEHEFLNIQFKYDWPLFVKHLADVLMGGNVLESKGIDEGEENINPYSGELCKEQDLNFLKNQMKVN